jgi:hypothetical protein
MSHPSQHKEVFSSSYGDATTREGTLGFGTRKLHPRMTCSATAHEESENTMWSTYLEEAREYDSLMTDAWKEDTKSFLVFVSPYPQIPCDNFSNNVKVRSFLHRCRRISHRKL